MNVHKLLMLASLGIGLGLGVAHAQEPGGGAQAGDGAAQVDAPSRPGLLGTDADQARSDFNKELRSVEDQWGVRILEFGFSNISPSPTTLEITQLELLTQEKLALYRRLKDDGLADEAAVALVSGAVVSVHPDEDAPSRRRDLGSWLGDGRAGSPAVGLCGGRDGRGQRERRRRERRPEASRPGWTAGDRLSQICANSHLFRRKSRC